MWVWSVVSMGGLGRCWRRKRGIWEMKKVITEVEKGENGVKRLSFLDDQAIHLDTTAVYIVPKKKTPLL